MCTICAQFRNSRMFFCSVIEGSERKSKQWDLSSFTSSLRNKLKITQLKIHTNLSQPHNLNNTESPCLLFEWKELKNLLTLTVLLKFNYPNSSPSPPLHQSIYYPCSFISIIVFLTSLHNTFTVKQYNCTVHILTCNATTLTEIISWRNLCESNIILSYRVTALECIAHISLKLTVYKYKTYWTFRNQYFW